MTKEGAIGNLIHAIRWNDMPMKEALDMAIEALGQELKTEKTFKMCNITPEEREIINKYIKSISKPTGVNFWDLYKEPCEDCISREDALLALTGEWTELTDEIIHRFIKRIRALPSVKPQENERNCVTCEWSKDSHSVGTEECHLCMRESQYKPKIGHWITTRTFMHDGEFYCDRCKCDSPQNEKWDYCPNCGAKMQETERK